MELPTRAGPRRRIAMLCLAILLATAKGHAQDCQEWMPFGVWRGVDGNVNAITQWTDDRVVVAGSFSLAGQTVPASNIAVYRAGEIWTSLDQGLNGRVNAVLVLASGDLVVGGKFTAAGDQIASNLARFDAASGSWAAIGAGTSGAVNALLQLPDGRVAVGGAFETAGGVLSPGAALWSPVDNTWQPMSSGVAGSIPVVNCLGLLPDGQIVAGGTFDSAGGLPIKYLASYSTLTNTWSPLGSGVNAPVNTVLLHPDGWLYVGGRFTIAGGVTVTRIARFNAGTWSALAAPITLSGGTPVVMTLGLLPNGNVFVGGMFSAVGTQPTNNMAMYLPANPGWKQLGSTQQATGKMVLANCPMLDNSVYYGGTFTGSPEHVGRVALAAGAQDLGNGVRGTVEAIRSLPDGFVVIGGEFSSVSDLPVNNIAMFDGHAKAWRTLGDGFDGVVRSIIQLEDGTIVAGGKFAYSGTTAVNCIAWYDQSSNQWLPIGTGLTEFGNEWRPGLVDMCELPGRELVVCGGFHTAGGNPASNIAIYNFTTQEWRPLGPGVGTAPFAVRYTSDNAIYVGGATGGFGPLARYDLGSQIWSAVGTFTVEFFSPIVISLAVLRDGDLIVGGSFNSINGVPIKGLGRMGLADGAWSPFIPDAPASGADLYTLANGDMLVGTGVRVHPATGEYFVIPTNPLLSQYTATGELIVDGRRSFLIAGNYQYPFSTSLAEFVDGGPILYTQPATLRQCRAQAAQFTLEADAPAEISFRWQIESTSGQFVDLFDGPSDQIGVVEGSGTSTLTLSSVRPAAATKYRCVVTNNCTPAISDPAALMLCLSDLNCDDTSDLTDYFDFFNAWDISGPAADIDADGEVDLADFFAFFNAFDAQC